MARYLLLFFLNIPFVIYGFIRTIAMFREARIGPISFLIRLIFWSSILFCLIFARGIYNYLLKRNLVYGSSLSVAIIILATGIVFSFFLMVRLYSRLDMLERRETDLMTKLSILLSENKKR